MSTFISYAQNFEDVLLWRALKHIESGFYIDIGANSPIIDSVSLAFYENGWTGINVEPSLKFVQELHDNREKDVNLHAAISDDRGVLKFYDIAETGLSTLLKEVADKHAQAGFQVSETMVPVITLDDLLQDVSTPEVHWMKIDVEGAEQQVLRGWKTSTVHPWVVVVESVLPSTHVESHAGWESILLDKGYRFAFFDGLNRYFVSESHLDLLDAFQVGPNVFDRFCLSGTATSTFCAIVNHKALVAAENLSTMAAELSESRDELTQSIEQRELAERKFYEREAEQQKIIASTWTQLEESQRANTSLHAGFELAENESKQLRNRMIETLSEYRSLIQDRNQAQESLSRHVHQLSMSKAEAEALKAEQGTLMANLRASSLRIGSLESALAAVEGQVKETLNSTSWKVTAPLRFLSAIARGSKSESSSYFRETLRNLAQVPALRRIAERLLPEHGRARRFLVARVRTDTSHEVSSATRAQLETYDGASAERSRLFNRMASRIRDERRHMERLK
ncbi:FkbM family methyltransferase [Pseudoxanthomonas sacheonensis]|uniref:FkbM family methyltransferase n=1 Tax=Pseudoxanthomonas sacheonensis TaxID=443615 RepID=A0ABU1RVV5_9GAMM|nr:FkbM family methyltransferase [Pseudoxanthomonas sacheonensis]MDR6842916.1 FkbM family methyltransferase [Pseudoxanthomonas sacheonensis]